MKQAILFSLLILPIVLQAHPGHDFFNGYSFQHFMTSPLHLFTLFGGIVGCVFAFWLLRRFVKTVE